MIQVMLPNAKASTYFSLPVLVNPTPIAVALRTILLQEFGFVCLD
jgi:hypothetical protein